MKSYLNTTGWHKAAFFAIFLLFFFTTVGCGQKPKLVKSISLQSHEETDGVYAEFKTILDIGNVQLPNLEIPIYDPRNLDDLMGKVKIVSNFYGYNEIGIAVNLTTALQIQGGAPTLPNGHSLPIGGLDSTTVIQIPLGNTGAYIYIAAGEGVALMGFAVAFKEFDPIGQSLGGVDLFPAFNFEGVRAVAGIFTSRISGKSGFAAFVDLGAILDPSDLMDIKMDGAADAPQPLALMSPSYGYLGMASYALKSSVAPSYGSEKYNQSKLSFSGRKPSSRVKKSMDKKLYKLHKRRTRLSIR